MERLFSACAIIYVLLYAGEGAVRYGLYNLGLDNAILLRDLLLVLPLALLFVAQGLRGRMHPAFPAFAAVVALHGAIATLNLGSTLPAVYGAKLMVNLLFGFLAARSLVQPGRRVLAIFALVWLVTVTGVVLDKFVFTFPWMGLETHIGGIKVDISRGWDIDSGIDKRAAGFTRSSISAAMLLPTLALVLAPRIGSLVLRALLLVTTIAAVLLTTQKGAVLALAAVSVALCAPRWSRHALLCAACLGFALLAIALPLVTAGLLASSDGGVFSIASFAMRITLTWPDAWRWIANHEVFPFGVGLGGIGGAQRFYAPNFFNPSDNLFVFLYANFGLLALAYLGWIVNLALRQPPARRGEIDAALAVLGFLLGYGAALSILEDQVAALFIGAAAGMLWRTRRAAQADGWAEPFTGTQPQPVQLLAGVAIAGRAPRP